ncbi:methyl-accepting chemotaxis protein [Pseudomonas sp. NPDC086251]|uniref:methyl-accepting chemotaxis protein n=1 Tax=Pseudomonas sp. NPDC086251 TaxID=3364431 RepID=UPI00383664A5
MAQNLRQLIGFIGDGTVRIAGAAEQLSVTTGQTNAGVTRQREETDQVATAMNEMAHTVRGVARDAEEASVAATQADEEAKIGDLKLKQVIQEMEHLADEVSLCAKAIQSLQGECRQIGGVLTVIKSLAEQTNLLALNAAIEAARAGEAGSGFAVVADEVRALAQRTQKAATEIDSLVGTLLVGASNATDSMSSSRELASRTLDLGREAGQSLSSISQTISVMQAMNLQIAAAAEEQSAVAEQINTSIYEVRTISEQTAKASEDTATSSTALSSLGGELQTHVERFQI